jgi:integrase
MNLLFWLVRNKANKSGESPIYCRITIGGERAEIFTGISARENEFDTKRKRLKGTSEIVKQRNLQLDKIDFRLNQIFYNEVLNNCIPTANHIKTIFNTKQKHISLFLDLLNDYSEEQFKVFKSKERKEKHTRYILLLRKALNDLNKTKIQIDQCDNYFLDSLAHYIINEEKYSVGYTKKVFGFIKTAMLYAFNRKYVDRNLSHEYKVPFQTKSEIVYLDELEVNKIVNHTFEGNLQKYADLFVIQCYTGLSYADLRNLRATHLIKDHEGLIWINIKRQKVDTAECTIPVLSKVWDLMKKYGFELPKFSNQKYNAALKKISAEVGIRKKLTTHVGRKTYGTLLLNKDVPIETVSKLLGHSSIAITQKHYAKVLHMKIARDIKKIM